VSVPKTSSTSLTTSQHKKMFQTLNKGFLESVQDLKSVLHRPVTSNDVIDLAWAPSTLASHLQVEKDYLKTISTLQVTPWTPESIMAYITNLMNRPTWHKASSLYSRLKLLWGIAARRGVPKLSEDTQLKALSRGLRRIHKSQEVTRAVPMTQLVLNDLINKLIYHPTRPDYRRVFPAMLSLAWLLAMRIADLVRITYDAIDIKQSPIRIYLHWHKCQMSQLGEVSVIPDSQYTRLILEYHKTITTLREKGIIHHDRLFTPSAAMLLQAYLYLSPPHRIAKGL
jgi:integrase